MDARTGIYWEWERRPELWQMLGEPMRRHYEPFVREPIPEDMCALLGQLDRARKKQYP